jgi:hypothetical protein
MKKVFLVLLCLAAFDLSTNAQDPVVTTPRGPGPTRRIVSADQVNGLYRYRGSEFRILALGHNKLKVQFNGEWMTRGGYPNIGEAMGEATIEGNVATFIPGDTTRCKITMTFLTNRMEVTQEGTDADCGFGHNVMATGTYRRIKGGKPRFIPVQK